MSGAPSWAEPYIGVPFLAHGRDPNGWDCWGCARWIWQHHFGIAVPSFMEDYQTPDDQAVVAQVIAERRAEMPWRERPLVDARPGDALLLRVDGHPMHVAVMLTHEFFIHVDRRSATCLERITSARWNRRLLGVYRYGG